MLNGEIHLNSCAKYEKITEVIEIDPSFIFVFVEEKEDVEGGPVSEYFMKLDDLSINLMTQFKWIKWGVHFMTKISNTLKNPEKNGLPMCQILNKDVFEKCIQNVSNFNIEEKTHVLTINNQLLNLNGDIQKLLTNTKNKNSIIEIKLKINLREFLLLSN